jgi:hypothetical protein
MGWADCGNDSKGRPIGYGFSATCDYPGCEEKIDRGLSYACGGMHGIYDRDGHERGCEGYFCEKHRTFAYAADRDTFIGEYCLTCAAEIEAAESASQAPDRME